jgi:hypothetical protein
MQQHPVPQNISSFEFKLIGFLTIKQFSYLAVAGVFSFMFFIAPINFLLRLIIILPFAGIGIALAFVSISGLPFDKWLVVFTKSIYSPSRRLWHKTPKEISFLSPWFSSYLKRPVALKPRVGAGDRSKLEAYLEKLRREKRSSHLDDFEERKLSSLNYSATVPNIKDLGLDQPNNVDQTPKQPATVSEVQEAGPSLPPTRESEEPPWLK